MLRLVIGPMFSGKTFFCIRLARRYRAIGKNVLFVNSHKDTRYSDTCVVTHDGDSEKCIFLENLKDLIDKTEYVDADVVVIEEAQFFTDLYDVITTQSDISGKEFIVSGLSGDYQRQEIGGILSLIPYAEYVDKLSGLCQRCKDGTLGSYSLRLTEETDQISIGGKNRYECVCRKHFLSCNYQFFGVYI